MPEADVVKVLQEHALFESLEKHPGWVVVKEKLDAMLDDATNKLEEVDPTDTEAVKAAHRDWRAVRQVKTTLLDYITQTHEIAINYLELQKENENGNDSRNA